MTRAIHPKTSGAALGGALGVLIVAVLHSIHGVHLAAEANAAIPTFLSALGAYLSPNSAADPPASAADTRGPAPETAPSAPGRDAGLSRAAGKGFH